ncbi:GntR family transcriptional regulator [Blautia schinkii]|nr:GntR family transcriptional regulator [Blautia schinkii]
MKKVVNTIRGQVYELMKQGICDGDYKPGQWLQEKEIAEQFSISRSPVREALRQLAADGLVVDVPNKGAFVREFTAQDMEEIFDLRVMMENYAIEKTAQNLDEDAKTRLNNCLEELERDYDKNDLKRYIEDDRRLHDLFVELSHNSLLAITYERISTMIQQFRVYSLSSQDRFDGSVTEHREIIHCLINREISKAQQINSRHLQLAKERIIIYLENGPA